MRRATYHKDGRPFRVVFRHPNRWVLQEKGSTEGTRTNDPWFNISPFLPSYEDAVALMYQRYPPQTQTTA